jgi:hypothetical protein
MKYCKCHKNDELLEVLIISISSSLVSGWNYNFCCNSVVHHVAEIHLRVGLMATM